ANGDERRRQRHEPGDTGKQRQPHQQSQSESRQSRAVALMRRKFVGKNGDENEIVDAENDLQHHKSGQAHPDRRIGDPFHRYVQCPSKLQSDRTSISIDSRRWRPPSSGSSMTKLAASTLPPARAKSLTAASAVPPVAIRSSMSSTRMPSLIASEWISTMSVPYSSAYSCPIVFQGSLPFLRTGTK